jgi:hypothetical protein
MTLVGESSGDELEGGSHNEGNRLFGNGSLLLV